MAYATAVSARWIAASGFLVGALLSAEQLMTASGQESAATRALCDTAGNGCDKVAQSRWAVFPPESDSGAGPLILGRPVPTVHTATLGVAYFCCALAWTLFAGVPSTDQPTHLRFFAVLLVSGVLASIGLIYLMGAVIGVWCPLCLVVHGANLFAVAACGVSVVSAQRASKENVSDRTERGKQGTRAILCALTLGVTCALLAEVFSEKVRLQTENARLAETLDEWQNNTGVLNWLYESVPEVSIGIDPQDPVIAAQRNPKMSLVVFTDLNCPLCTVFEKQLVQVVYPQFEGHLEIVFKHFPLCSDCNLSLSKNLHPAACDAAFLAEAARIQGGMPAFLKMKAALAEPRESTWTDEELSYIATRLDLDVERLWKDRDSDVVRNRVAAHIAEGQRLNIEGTPTAFLNGRQIRDDLRSLPAFWTLMANNLLERETRSADSVARNGGSHAVPDSIGNSAQFNSTQPESSETIRIRATRYAELLMRYQDENGDNVLDADEWTHSAELFANSDSDKDGRLVVAELRDFYIETRSRGAAVRKASQAENQQLKIPIGEPIQIAGPLVDGTPLDVKQFKGKPVIVVFWASWCDQCRAESTELKHVYSKWHGSGLEIVGVSLDHSADELTEFVDDKGLVWPQIYYPTGDSEEAANPFIEKFGLQYIPTLVLLDREGQVVSAGEELEITVARATSMIESVSDTESDSDPASDSRR